MGRVLNLYEVCYSPTFQSASIYGTRYQYVNQYALIPVIFERRFQDRSVKQEPDNDETKPPSPITCNCIDS